jgi:hypothetical protein
MIPNASICASPDRKKIEIASAVPEQVNLRTGPKNVIFPLKDKKPPIGLAASLVASAFVVPAIRESFVPHVSQESHQAILSLEDQQVRAGLLIAMKLAASEPTTGAIAVVEIDDKSIAIPDASDSAEVAAKAPKSRRNSKKQKARVEPIPLESLKFLTIAQTALRYQVHTEKALYHLQAQAEAYQRYPKAGLRSTGFIECLFRPDGKRKIIINAAKYEQFLVAHTNQQRLPTASNAPTLNLAPFKSAIRKPGRSTKPSVATNAVEAKK